VKKVRKGHVILIKGKIYQEELSILNIHTPNARAPAFIKETLLKLKAHIALHTIIVGDFNTPLSTMQNWVMERETKWIMERETKQRHIEINRSNEPNDLTDVHKTFYSKTKGYTFFSAPHGTFSQIDHLIGHKTGLNRYKNIEIIPGILSDHHGIRLVFNSNKNNRKPTYAWKLINALLSDKLVKKEIPKN
jgi:exonuclease III